MNEAHSPGPWTSDPEGEVAWTVEDANGNPIVDVYIERDEHDEPTPACCANDRLIQAAPDLLRELRKGRALAHREWAVRARGELGEPYLRDLVASMDAAIRLATPR